MPSQHFETILAGTLLSFLLTVAAPLEAQLSKSERKWVRSTLADLSLHEKAAQMVMVRSFGRYSHPRSDTHRDLLTEVRDLGVGGLVIFDSDLESIPRLLDELQQAADIPLLVAVDSERGMSFRVRRGTVSLPYAMAIGATGSEDAARFVGEVTAREGRALGIHWTLAPVADVNNNPANPIINIRSFGEDPELVGRMVRAFIAGARAEGQLTTAKHFPGHGDTAVDSHVALPTLDVDRTRLDAIELTPFRAAIAAGVDAVMLGHIAVPAIDPSGAPATLSKAIATDLLRGELGFRGLIVTDALEMDGLAAWTGAAVVRSVQAGADVLLLPADPRIAVQSLVRAVEEGEISEERLNASVARILEAKARLGLPRRRRIEPEAVARDVARPEDVAKALEIAKRSITVVRNDGGILPLRAEQPLRLLHLVMSSDLHDLASRRFSAAEINARRIPVETRYLGPEVTTETIDELVAAATETSHVVVSAFARTASSEGRSELSRSQTELLRQLHGSGRPVILISFGSPYLLMRVLQIPAYVCAYGAAEASQRAAIAVLFGETDAGGRLPVTLPGLFDSGHGLEIPRREMTLRRARPEEAGFRPDGFAEVDRLLDDFLEQQAFPGGVLAVGHRGALVHLRPFGRLSYDDDEAVTANTLYDLASL
ncbi:MAG: glycoside hydrolase family 3 N-terminal domain-containing protein, partial [Thermoanaerobaculia bacterium]